MIKHSVNNYDFGDGIMTKDFMGITLNVGDEVIFPSSGEMMTGIIEKIKEIKSRSKYNPTVLVRNKSGNKKWQKPINLINKSAIESGMPQYFV